MPLPLRLRTLWPAAAALLIVGAGTIAVVAYRTGAAGRPVVSLHLAYGHVTQPFTLGSGDYHVEARITRCEGGVYGLFADPLTVPPHATGPSLLPALGSSALWQNEVTLPGPMRFLVAQSDGEAAAYGQQRCTADVSITRTGDPSGPREWPPISVHCTALTTPCPISTALDPGTYALRVLPHGCGDWSLEGVDATGAEHALGLDTLARGNTPWTDVDLPVTTREHLGVVHARVTPALAGAAADACDIAVTLYRLSPDVAATPSATRSACTVTAFGVAEPTADGRGVDVYASLEAAVVIHDALVSCPVNHETITVSVIGRTGARAPVRGNPTILHTTCGGSCGAMPPGLAPPEIMKAGVRPVVWSNWCGGDVHVVVDVVLDGAPGHTDVAIPGPPACTAPGQPSTLVRG